MIKHEYLIWCPLRMLGTLQTREKRKRRENYDPKCYDNYETF